MYFKHLNVTMILDKKVNVLVFLTKENHHLAIHPICKQEVVCLHNNVK